MESNFWLGELHAECRAVCWSPTRSVTLCVGVERGVSRCVLESNPSSSRLLFPGLDHLHEITSVREHILRIEMKSFEGELGYAEYKLV